MNIDILNAYCGSGFFPLPHLSEGDIHISFARSVIGEFPSIMVLWRAGLTRCSFGCTGFKIELAVASSYRYRLICAAGLLVAIQPAVAASYGG